jgi:hypothetical protein
VTVQGSIAWSDGHPVSADVVFEASGIYAVASMPATASSDAGPSKEGGSAGEGGEAGLQYPLQTQGFEYVAHTTAQPDLAASDGGVPESGVSTYSIVLPPGEYRISVRPLDVAPSPVDAGPPSHGVLVIDGFDTGQGADSIPGPDIAVPVAPILSGTAVVADGRPLSGATVEALPVHCAQSMRNDGGTPLPDSPACMPRYAQGQTADSDGSFALALDPGEYLVRVEPVDGTRLPWVAQSVSVPPSGQIAFRIPAPVHRELQLFGQDGIAVTNAVVRMFTVPASGLAIELGRAVTDPAGRFDMYIDPAAQ